MRSHKLAALAAAFALTLGATTPAYAWGPLGHRIVAALAWHQLTPATRSAVDRLLASESPYITLVSIANWPDELRDYPQQRKLWERTRKLHYVDIDNTHCLYRPARQCVKGQCVVAGIEHYEAILGNVHEPTAERLRALKFVVHLIGDEHQPYHAFGPDLGGNTYEVTFFGNRDELHRVWDSGLLDTRELTWKPYAKLLEAEGPVALPAAQPGVPPAVSVAEASCRIARQAFPTSHTLGWRYVNRWRPVAEHQLRLAGARLARVLNRELGGHGA